jgi:hypothetical protein
MALPINRPATDIATYATTTSIATTPVAATCIVPAAGFLQRVVVTAAATTTGTVAVAVGVNGATDVTGGVVSLAASTGIHSAICDIPTPISVNEGDLITLTPSGGTGATVVGYFAVVIR